MTRPTPNTNPTPREEPMTPQFRTSLKELQKLDRRIAEARKKVSSFDPVLAEIDEPALALETDVEATRGRLKEMRLEARRLESSADERRSRTKKLQERMNEVRNLREEAAVHAELDMLRRALEGDEQEALGLLDQIRKLELRLDEQEAALEEARAELEPRRQELLREREEARDELAGLEDRRKQFAEEIDDRELRLYERIRSGKREVAVAELTPDGACGVCFSMIPLQLQTEVRDGRDLVRCEACGVILAARPEESSQG